MNGEQLLLDEYVEPRLLSAYANLRRSLLTGARTILENTSSTRNLTVDVSDDGMWYVGWRWIDNLPLPNIVVNGNTVADCIHAIKAEAYSRRIAYAAQGMQKIHATIKVR